MPREPKTSRKPRPTLTVEATATIDDREVWLDVGLGRILHTAAGKKVRMTLGAVPDGRELYISVTDVLRLDAEDDLEKPEAFDNPIHLTH